MGETSVPEVLWAQRSSSSDASKNFIYLTIVVSDVPKKDVQLDLKPTSLTFTGTSETKNCKYHLELEFYDEIDPPQSIVNHTTKAFEIKLQKKELKAEYWPRLLKSPKKDPCLKTDFDKWVDEDEQDGADDIDFSQFGGMGGMGGLGAVTGGAFSGLDFSKLGGGSMDAESGDLGDEDTPVLDGEIEKSRQQ